MRGTSLMVECATFRHTVDISVYERDQSSMTRQKVLIEKLPGVRFAFLSSTGLSKGESGQFEIVQNTWKTIQSQNEIVLRFFQKLYDYFLQKKIITFNYKGKQYSINEMLDVNGEGVYLNCTIGATQ